MRLTPPFPLHWRYEAVDSLDLAYLLRSCINFSELAQLRWGKIPHDEHIVYLAKCQELAFAEQCVMSRISDHDEMGDDVERFEHLAVRDVDLPPMMHPSQAPDSIVQELNPGARMTGSLENTYLAGRIVAHAWFSYCPEDWASHYSDKKPQEDPKASPPPPAGRNTALDDHFKSLVVEMGLFHIRGRRCYLLRDLQTLTSHLRKGIASQLVSWIFPIADDRQLPVYLAATPLGLLVYQKLGFVEIGGDKGAVEMDMAEWGGSGVYRQVMMVRLPKQEVSGEE